MDHPPPTPNGCYRGRWDPVMDGKWSLTTMESPFFGGKDGAGAPAGVGP